MRDQTDTNIIDVVSTVLFTGLASNMGSMSEETPAHRGLYQHQITIQSSAALAAGTIEVRFLPDEVTVNGAIDTGSTLVFSTSDSDIAFFTAALRGIMLKVTTTPTSGQTLQCVLTSVRGPLINS